MLCNFDLTSKHSTFLDETGSHHDRGNAEPYFGPENFNNRGGTCERPIPNVRETLVGKATNYHSGQIIEYKCERNYKRVSGYKEYRCSNTGHWALIKSTLICEGEL